ncbi:MAG TPA: ATP-binding protein [Solirubrobacteraceae bacterium]|jgi:anti-sigma regulatory factor (Ser/Thr protein kinase)|nr:ATP-binding protein [Solirubrobacteraceae bacterium]
MSLPSTRTPDPLPHAELRLPADVGAPALARRTVRDLLSSLPDPLRAQLSLVASELVTNVLRHSSATDPSATLSLALAPDRVTLTVSDAGAGFDPSDRPRSPSAEGGWGLQVLDAIADRWWVEWDGRTRVICEIDR